MKPLNQEFGVRLVTLNSGQCGLRAGLRCEVKAPADLAADAPVMDFVATDETLDRYNEVIKINGWQLDNFRRNPVVVDSHDYSSVAKILGRSPNLRIEAGQMVNRVEFAVDNPLGLMAWKMAKGGFIKSESVGFIPVTWENGKTKDQPDRTYLKQELLEISLVAIPANPGATLGLALKSGALVKSDLSAVADLLKSICSQKETPLPKAGATGQDEQLARCLQLARQLNTVLSRA